MTNQEMVDLLQEKADVSPEVARDALERANWDLLDAVLVLEQDGRLSFGAEAYSTKDEEEAPQPQEKRGHVGVRNAVRWTGQTIRKLVRIGNANQFVITRGEEELLNLPVTAFAVILIFLFWLAAVALVVGLFCGLRYSFRGPNLGKQAINDAMDRAAEVAESVKEDLMGEHAAPSEKDKEEE